MERVINLLSLKIRHQQKGAIVPVLTLVALGVITVGIIAAGRLVEIGTRFLPKAECNPVCDPFRVDTDDCARGPGYINVFCTISGWQCQQKVSKVSFYSQKGEDKKTCGDDSRFPYGGSCYISSKGTYEFNAEVHKVDGGINSTGNISCIVGAPSCSSTESCGPNMDCVTGTCKCKEGINKSFANCDGDWSNGCEIDLMNDNNNCGECNRSCPTGNQCIKGSCQSSAVTPTPTITGQPANTPTPTPTWTPAPTTAFWKPTATPTPPSISYSCSQDGQMRCWANAIREKCLGGQWVIVENCAEKNKACTDGASCTERQTSCTTPYQNACYGNTVIQCLQGQWVPYGSCANDQVCYGGTCVYVPPQCSTGATTCLNNNFVTCPNRYWKLSADCSLNNAVCNEKLGCVSTSPTPTPAFVEPTSTPTVTPPVSPTLTPTSSPHAAKLKFKVKLPDVASSVATIPASSVQIVLTGGGNTLGYSIPLASENGYFGNSAEDLQVGLSQPTSFSISIKQQATIRKAFRNVTLTPNQTLNCTLVSSSSDCGELITQLDKKSLLSGDTDGFNSASDSYNKIDIADFQRYVAERTGAVTTKTSDFNLDGKVDTIDLGILARNFGLVGD